MIDPQEATRFAESMDALLGELGGEQEIQELDVAHFAAQLDDDDDQARRALDRIASAGQHHRVAGLLLEVFVAALSLGNPGLARAAREGVQALVRGKLGEAS